MKQSEIKDLSIAELRKKSVELDAELFQNKMKNRLGRLANPLEIRFIRKDIARLNTALSVARAGVVRTGKGAK